MKIYRFKQGRFWLFLSALTVSGLAQTQAAKKKTNPTNQSIRNRISAESLRGHLSFIAADLLEGRGTPSRGLDIAAEYIAAQFRHVRLQAVGQRGYFQTATWAQMVLNPVSQEEIGLMMTGGK